ALSGFLMMMTQNGKLLYISDNAAEYLGHSMLTKSWKAASTSVTDGFLAERRDGTNESDEPKATTGKTRVESMRRFNPCDPASVRPRGRRIHHGQQSGRHSVNVRGMRSPAMVNLIEITAVFSFFQRLLTFQRVHRCRIDLDRRAFSRESVLWDRNVHPTKLVVTWSERERPDGGTVAITWRREEVPFRHLTGDNSSDE
ncbi:unnamed protein product, partial [Nesidiocoris tenuis]